jgi:creatinase
MQRLQTVEDSGDDCRAAAVPDRPRKADFRGNGNKAVPTFSVAEMKRRQGALRALMVHGEINAALFTSYHNICYFSDFLYCRFGRHYGLVIDHHDATTVSAGIDGGQPWRRTFGDNITYTDWEKDNYFHALRDLLKGVRRLGIEFDQVDIELNAKLREAFPDVELIDIAPLAMQVRMIKSEEEIAHITEMARVADIGGAACVEALCPGVREYEVALHATQTMVHEIAVTWPQAEIMDTWTWFQSGLNTDGAHNPVTSRQIQTGDILSLNCFPMVAGYYVALERTLFCETASNEALRLWEINCKVHDRGKELLVPGARCNDVARELNALYEDHQLLQYRSFGYGHSFGVLCHYYGREGALELREDCETVLEPGMVVSMEPMITVPDHLPGGGGYREHDILVITEDGNRNITQFPYGPEQMIITTCPTRRVERRSDESSKATPEGQPAA